MRFADPLALLLLAAVPVYLWLRWPRRSRVPRGALPLPTLGVLAAVPRASRERWARVPVALRAVVLTLLVLALARPRSPGAVRDDVVKGRNIVLMLDISSSMKAADFAPSRIAAARDVLADFVRARAGDFMGLVLFAGRPFTQAPLTDDESTLLQLLRGAEIGLLPDGTGIGAALAMGENMLKDLPRHSGVIVLVTDGGNNTGTPDPLTAAELARAIGVRIYTIGMAAGTPRARLPDEWVRGRGSLYDSRTPSLTSQDEHLLQEIARVSGGAYYRASSAGALAAIAQRIDGLEKGVIHRQDIESWHEFFPLLLVPAALLFLLEMGLGALWLRTAP